METFAAVRLEIDSWRWAGVPFLIRAGKCLPVTATEVLVQLKRPAASQRNPGRQQLLSLSRWARDLSISIGARIKRPGPA